MCFTTAIIEFDCGYLRHLLNLLFLFCHGDPQTCFVVVALLRQHPESGWGLRVSLKLRPKPPNLLRCELQLTSDSKRETPTDVSP